MIDDNLLDHPFTEPECEVIEADEEEPPRPFTVVDVWLYPISPAGLSVMAVYVVMPVIAMLLSQVMLGILGIMLDVAVRLSTIWYLTVCIRGGADGQRRAPGLFECSDDDTPLGWLREFFLLLATVLFCLAPAFIIRYLAHVEHVPLFWSILAAGLFLLPMALLSMVIFDHLGALNPALLIPSIISTFWPYCRVVVLFSLPIVLIAGVWTAGARAPILPVIMLVRAAGAYLLMVAAGTLGWFFHKNEERLRWDV